MALLLFFIIVPLTEVFSCFNWKINESEGCKVFKYCRQSSLVINRSWSELPQSHIFKFISFHADRNCRYNFSTLSSSWIDTFTHAVLMALLCLLHRKSKHNWRFKFLSRSWLGWAHMWEHLQINDIYFKNCEKIPCKAACTNSLGISIPTS